MLVSQTNLVPHERIGRYEVLRKIATGGMAELFLAKQVGMEGFEKVVAIKRILAHLAFDEEFINMFRDEARIVAKLSHPNIVQIYDLGKSDDTYFIAMEYIPGRNLSSVAKKAKAKGVPLPPEYIARCMAQACEGLYYAHTRQDIDGRPLKIVHRDVSPQNIILAFSGAVKLVDFGIAKAAIKIAHTRAGVLKGKYAYMSPEQIRGEEIDARSDLFAAGIVLYELLCGRRPFEKENSIQTLKAIVQEPHVDCRLLNPNIPDPLAAIIDRALSKSNLERWQSAQELQLALEDFVTNCGTRCNNIAISRWVSDLFAEELSRDRGGTMSFKGVGEVILPEEEKLEKAASDGQEAERGAAQSGGASPASADHDASVALSRGRGGGSISPRPPIPAPSTALGDLSGGHSSDLANSGPIAPSRLNDEPASIESIESSASGSSSSNREGLIEEGIIDRPGGRQHLSPAFHDDRTIKATDDFPPSPRLLSPPPSEPPLEAEPSAADIDEPELAHRPRAPSTFDDSKTEFMGDPPSPPAAGAQEERHEYADDKTRAPAQAPAPTPDSVSGGEMPEDMSLEAEPLGPEDDEPEPQPKAPDPWDEATVGYPDGKAPIEFIGESGSLGSLSAPDRGQVGPIDDDRTRSELDQIPALASTGPESGPVPVQDPLGDGNTSEIATVPPLEAEALAADDILQASTWAMSREELPPERSGENDDQALWDDQTATNDAYPAEEPALPAPSVEAVPAEESAPGSDDDLETGDSDAPGERTINVNALDGDVIEHLSEPPDELSGEATLSSAVFEEIERAHSMRAAEPSPSDPTVGPHSPPSQRFRAGDDHDTQLGSVQGSDATLSGSAISARGDEEEIIDFDGVDESTSRAFEDEPPAREFEESILPASSSVSDDRALNLDSRTVAGVKQDYLGSGLPIPDDGTYDEEQGVEVDFQDAHATESEMKARPQAKPKRGAQGLGAIKLAKVSATTPASDATEASDRVEERPSFDASEEATEAGSVEVDDPDNEEATQGMPHVLSRPPPAPLKKEVKVDFDLFDEFSIEQHRPPTTTAGGGAQEPARKPGGLPTPTPSADRPPLAPVRPSSIGPKGSSLPLSAPPTPGGFSIGSSNVPPASMSLSEMLAIPVGASRSSFQVISRGSPQTVQPPSARPRAASFPGRHIREVVRPPQPQNGVVPAGPGANGPNADFLGMMPAPAALLDLPLQPGHEAPVARRSQRVLLTVVIMLLLCVIVGAAYLLVPQLLPRDPQLTIRTAPEAAQIYLNGQLQPAVTPATLGGLQAGVTYELKLMHAGYEVVQNQVLIPKTTRNVVVQIQLKPIAAVQPAASPPAEEQHPAVEPLP